jgi:hypothetical protein
MLLVARRSWRRALCRSIASMAVAVFGLSGWAGCSAQGGAAPRDAAREPWSSTVVRADPSTEAEEQPGPRVVVLRTDGQALPAGAWSGRLSSRLSACKLTPGTVLQVRLTRGSGRTHIELGPSAATDDAADRCVRAALATIDADGVFARPSPADRPSGFTALLQLEW